jgi:WD40 repeat protein
LQGHRRCITSVAFSPDGNYITSGSADSTIKLWSVNRLKEITTLKGHSDAVTAVAFSCDGKYLASGSDDSTIKLWRV